MTYRGPKHSCPHFDNALAEFDNIFDSIKDVVQRAQSDHEKEIEKAREINATLRDDNDRLTEELEKALNQISDLEDEIQKLSAN